MTLDRFVWVARVEIICKGLKSHPRGLALLDHARLRDVQNVEAVKAGLFELRCIEQLVEFSAVKLFAP